MNRKEKELKARYFRKSAELARIARQLADMDPSSKFSSLDVHHFSGDAPVITQTFATPPGTDLRAPTALQPPAKKETK
jgi:hypothetical protein